MTYLSSVDRIKLNIIEGYPLRALNEVELVIRHIQIFDFSYTYSDSAKTLKWGDKRKDELLTEIATFLGHNSSLADLARQALSDEKARTTLFAKYPYVQHFDLLNNRNHKGLLGCHLAGCSSYTVDSVDKFLKALYKIVIELPKNTTNTFVATNHTPAPRLLRNVAINSKEKALFGVTVSKTVQDSIYNLFGDACKDYIQTAVQFGLHHQPEMIEYFKANLSTDGSGLKVFNLFQIEECSHSEGHYLQVIMHDRHYSFYIERGRKQIEMVFKAAEAA